MEKPEKQAVVAAFLRHKGKVLLVRHSRTVGGYQERWSVISGGLEDSSALAQALRAIWEETGLPPDRVRLVTRVPPMSVAEPESGQKWLIYPLLFEIEDFELDDPGAIRFGLKQPDLCWIRPYELGDYPTMPALESALIACLAAEAAQNE